MVEIRLRHIHLHNPKEWKINGTHGPQKIRKYNIRIFPIITFPDNFKKIRSHKKLIHRYSFLMEKVKNHSPVCFSVHDNIQKACIFFL